MNFMLTQPRESVVHRSCFGVFFNSASHNWKTSKVSKRVECLIVHIIHIRPVCSQPIECVADLSCSESHFWNGDVVCFIENASFATAELFERVCHRSCSSLL